MYVGSFLRFTHAWVLRVCVCACACVCVGARSYLARLGCFARQRFYLRCPTCPSAHLHLLVASLPASLPACPAMPALLCLACTTCGGKEPFADYIKRRNDEIGNVQVEALNMIGDFIRDRTLQSQDQAALRELCMRYWNLPVAPPRVALHNVHAPHEVLGRLQNFLAVNRVRGGARVPPEPPRPPEPLLSSQGPWTQRAAGAAVSTIVPRLPERSPDVQFVHRVLRLVGVPSAPVRPYALRGSGTTAAAAAAAGHDEAGSGCWSALCVHRQTHGLLVGRGSLLTSFVATCSMLCARTLFLPVPHATHSRA